MKGLVVHVRYRRFTEWQLRTWLGLALIRFGLRITGASVVVECEDVDDAD